ncbi:PE-PPE domain-containing protein [Mycobacterium hubeiense]|uniref:PE-PPE domain-containing protein n=1 Tax=Mycobacterium hubeiense TaxID=1867256 RepID=UPI000C7ED9D3|nr:PE-PPE domain-containing protein [Mycobacterium sp. QGD 101]
MRRAVRSAIRSALVAIAVVLASVAIGLTTTFTAAVGLVVAVTPLIVPGTGTPNPAVPSNYMSNAVAYYIEPGGTCGAEGCADPVPVPYIAQFWPFPFPGWGGLSGARWNVSVASGVTRLTSELVGANNPSATHPVAILGYSQGATVTSIVKSHLAELPAEQKQFITIVLIGNPNRPDGGLFERLAMLGTVPILDATFGQPTPTDTGIQTYDIALQYDGVVDAPEWVLNPLALLNAAAGFEYTHPTYLAPDGNDPPDETPYGYTPEQVQAAVAAAAKANCTAATHCQIHGDTYYITLPAKTLPIMQPFLDLADATGTSAVVIPIVDLISPITQTLIETAYTRDDYGEPSPFRLVPRFNPVQVATDLVNDIPEGVNAALNPGLDPLPGWRDPLEPADEPQTDATTDDNAVVTLTSNSDAEPLIRRSSIARPNDGITDPDTAATDRARPSLRPIGNELRKAAKGFADSVSRAFQPSTKPKPDQPDTDDTPAATSEPAA